MQHCVLISGPGFSLNYRGLGSYRIANLLERLGWRVTVVDYVTQWLDFGRQQDLVFYLDSVIDRDTRFVGISYTWFEVHQVKWLVEQLRQRYPWVKIIGGAQHHVFAGKSMGFDIITHGYSDLSLEPILNYLFAGAAEPNHSYRDPGVPETLVVNSITGYPAVNTGDYLPSWRHSDYLTARDVTTIELGRGCVFACAFCTFPFLNVKTAAPNWSKDLYHYLESQYKKYGTVNYMIADDTFNDRDDKLEQFATVVERLSFKPNFFAYLRLDLLTARPQQVEWLIRARVWMHFYGIESFTHASAKLIGKGMATDRLQSSMLEIRRRFQEEIGYYRCFASMIAGLPGESPTDWQRSEQWFRDNFNDQYRKWNVLEIPGQSVPDNEKSKLAKDPSKYGLRPMTSHNRLGMLSDFIMNSKVTRPGTEDNMSGTLFLSDDIFYWEHDLADNLDALEFVVQNDTELKDRLLDPFVLLEMIAEVGIDRAYAMRGKDLPHMANRVVSQYIGHKLKDAERYHSETNKFMRHLIRQQIR